MAVPSFISFNIYLLLGHSLGFLIPIPQQCCKNQPSTDILIFLQRESISEIESQREMAGWTSSVFLNIINTIRLFGKPVNNLHFHEQLEHDLFPASYPAMGIIVLFLFFTNLTSIKWYLLDTPNHMLFSKSYIY